jgi:tyrosine-protein phosphatase SIW14
MVEKGSDKPKEQITNNISTGLKSQITGAIAVVVFLSLLMLLFSGKIDAFSTNVQRDIQAEKLSGNKWAEKIELAGLSNIYKVSEDLYRGAQPSKEGMMELKKLGIKTIVNLRSFHSDRDEIASRDFFYEHIYIKPWHPEEKEFIRFLEIVTDKGKQPVFVHCQHGADRTGSICAVYRAVVQGWNKNEAIEEMTKGGFGFHSAWQNLVYYIQELDIYKIQLDLFLKRLNRWDEDLLISDD